MTDRARQLNGHAGAKVLFAQQPWHGSAFSQRGLEALQRLTAATGLTPDDLNPASLRGRFMRHPWFLASAPLAFKGALTATEAAGLDPLVFGMLDSGGYQDAKSLAPLAGAQERMRRRWLGSSFGAALIHDAPTLAVDSWPRSAFRHARECLAFTFDNGLAVVRSRTPGPTEWLNVLQGRTRREADLWFEAMTPLNDRRRYGTRALTSWAFGGRLQLAGTIQLPKIVQIRDQGLIGARPRLHWLGVGRAGPALMLTAIQEGLRETTGLPVQVTFDSASALRIVGEFRRAFRPAKWTNNGISLGTVRVPDDDRYIGSDLPSPLVSPIGEHLTLGDLNVRRTGGRGSCWDLATRVAIAAHNTYVQLQTIEQANARAALDPSSASGPLPPFLLELLDDVRTILRSETPMRLIERAGRRLDVFAPNQARAPPRGALGDP